jgi:hypothetical protein
LTFPIAFGRRLYSIGRRVSSGRIASYLVDIEPRRSP